MGTYCRFKIKDDVPYRHIEILNNHLRKYSIEINTPNTIVDWAVNLNNHSEFLTYLKRPITPVRLEKENPEHWFRYRCGEFKVSGGHISEEKLRAIIGIFIQHLSSFEYITETKNMFEDYGITEEQYNIIKHLDTK